MIQSGVVTGGVVTRCDVAAEVEEGLLVSRRGRHSCLASLRGHQLWPNEWPQVGIRRRHTQFVSSCIGNSGTPTRTCKYYSGDRFDIVTLINLFTMGWQAFYQTTYFLYHWFCHEYLHHKIKNNHTCIS